MHHEKIEHVSIDTSCVDVPIDSLNLGRKELLICEALYDLGPRLLISEIAAYTDQSYSGARQTLKAVRKKGVVEFGVVKKAQKNKQGARSYTSLLSFEVQGRVLLPSALYDNLLKLKPRGRPRKDTVGANEVKIPEQRNSYRLFQPTNSTEQRNSYRLFEEPVEPAKSQNKYLPTFSQIDAVSADEIQNQITPLRGLLRARLNLNLSNLLKISELARGFFSFEKEKNALRAISFVQTELKPPTHVDKPTPISLAQTELHFEPLPQTTSIATGEETPTGFKLGGATRDSTWEYEGVPPFPTTRLVHPIEVPPPPRIDPNWTEDEQLAFLARVWTATIEHKTGQPCWTLRARRQGKGKNQKLVSGIDKHRDELLHAITLCLEHKLQPGPWIAFSYDEWAHALSKSERAEIEKNTKTKSRRRKRRKSPVAPPIKWVFSEARVEDRTGWYGHVLERELYRGTIRFTAKHKKLISRHTAMKFALMALSSPSQRDVDKIVDRFLPERYELLVRQCNADTAREQERLNRRAREGEWLWP